MSGVDLAAVDGDGNVDCVKAKAAGVNFAYLNATPGNSVWNQAAAFRAAGIAVGPYIFPTIWYKLNPVEQMKKALDGYVDNPSDLPLCLDVELPHGLSGVGLSRSDTCAWIIAAYNQLKASLGYSPMIYSSVRVLDTDDTDTLAGGLNFLANEAPLWLARYDGEDATSAPKAWGTGNYWIHQKYGDRKNVAGIRQVDVDAFNYYTDGHGAGNRETWIRNKLKGESVQFFQSSMSLTADSIIGPATFARLAKR